MRFIMDSMETTIKELKDIDKLDYRKPSKKTIGIVMVMSFFVPFTIMALAFLNAQIYPGGPNTVLIYDMKSQFLPIFASLRYLGQSSHSLFYSFFGALGESAFPNYSTYLVNPLSWITVLFTLEQLPNVLYYFTLLRIGLAGVSFATYLFCGKEKDRRDRYPVAVLILSSCYSLMSYGIMYGMCQNWLDILILLPIMMIGVERILEEKQPFLYIVALTYSLLNSFQLSYMAGLFLCIYLIYRIIEERKYHCGNILVKFVLSSICSLGISMPIFFPMLVNMRSGRTEAGVVDTVLGDGLAYYPIWKVLKRLLSCQYDTIDSGGLPLVFCGTITLVLVLVYFVEKKNSIYNKLFSLSVIVFYLASFCFVSLNRMWHGFMEPYCFPCRYSYTFSCFLLILAYNAVGYLGKKIIVSEMLKKTMTIFVLVVSMLELYLNAAYIIASLHVDLGYKLKSEYTRYVNTVQEIMTQIDDNDFFRIGRGDSFYSVNDGMLFGYNGIAYFSSFYNREVMSFLGTLGYSQNEHVLYDVGATPVTDGLFGVRYSILKQDENTPYVEKYTLNHYSLYKNEDALPIGYLVENSDTLYVDESNYGNVFLYHEIMLSELTGQPIELYESIRYKIRDITDESARHVVVDFIAEKEKPIWIFFKAPTEEELKGAVAETSANTASFTRINGKEAQAIRTDLSTVCVNLGTYEIGEKIELEACYDKYFGNPWIVYYDEDAYKKSMELLKKGKMSDVKCFNGKIEGKINVSNDISWLLLTLPYMDGYRIKVDGKLSPYEDYRGALVLVKLDKGSHSIEISYTPPGFEEGIILFAISILCLMIYAFISRNRTSKAGNDEKRNDNTYLT